jgi:ATP-dependent exoDNAse (exonuclease V) beta subunit
MITFDEVNHKYFNDFGEEYKSVTTFLNQFKKPFDADKHAARVAERENTTAEAVKNAWKALTVEAQEKGKNFHKAMEDYIKYGDVSAEHADLIKSLNKASEGFKCTQKKSECLLWHDGARIAGTADLILENDDSFFVMDFKTNKKFKFSSDFNEKLLEPLQFLDYCEYTIYTLQLSMYAYMKQQQSGKHCKGMKILYLTNNAYNNSRYWREIPIIYCKDTIEKLFQLRKTQIQNANTQ